MNRTAFIYGVTSGLIAFIALKLRILKNIFNSELASEHSLTFDCFMVEELDV